MLTAPGHPFTFDGKDYFLGRVTQGDKEQLHAFANATAVKAVREMAKFQTAEEATAAYAAAIDRVTSGHYWWDEEGGLAYRRTWAGFLRLCWITMKVQCGRGADGGARWVQPPFEDIVAMGQVEGGRWLLEQSNLANANPTPPPPQESTAGGGSTPNSPSGGESPSSGGGN